MKNELQIQLKHGQTKKLLVEYVSHTNQYLNFNELANKLNWQLTHCFIENASQSLQIQFDLSNAPKVFIIGFDKDLKKVGVSVNFNSSAAPFSMLLPEKYYLIIPFEHEFEPQNIMKVEINVGWFE